MRKTKKAFTLIEVMIVMAIIAVLAVLVIGAITVARRTAAETQNRAYGRSIQIGLESYYTKNKNYPAASNYTFTSIIATGAPLADQGIVVATTGGCASGTRSGGGTVSIIAGTPAYTIIPGNYDCSGDLPAGDQIKAPQ